MKDILTLEQNDLKAFSTRLSLALNAGEIGVWDWNIESNITVWDDRMFEIYGLEKMVPMPYDNWINAVFPEDRTAAEAAIQRVILNKTRDTDVFRIIKADNNVRYIQSSADAICDDSGKVIRVIGTNIDITSRKQTEDSLKNTMVALEKSEKELRDIFDNTQSGLMYITQDRILIKANQRLADILAYDSPEEMIGLSMRKLHLCEENYLEFGKVNFDTLQMGVNRYIEYELSSKDGSSIWCELSGKAIDDNIPADLSQGVLWTLNDISLRKEYEISLKKSEERYKSLFHANQAIELIIDPISQQLIDCNKSAENFYGYDRETLLSMKISDINVMSHDAIQKEMDRATEEKRNVFCFKHRLHDKSIRDVEVYAGPINLEGKDYLYSIIFDISQRVELEKTKSLLQERLSFAMQGSNDGLWDWNIKTNETFYSPRWKSILGYADDELQNDFSIWETLIHPDDSKRSWMEFERLLASQDSQDRFSINFRMRHKDGHYVPILSRAKKVFNNNNETERLVGTHVDMTEIKVLEQELEESYETLHKLTENIPGAIYQYRLYPDGRSRFPYASHGITDIYEVSPEDVLHDAQPVFDNLHQDDLEMIAASIEDSAKTMKDWNIQYRVNLPKKGVRWIEGYSKPEKLEDGSIIWHGFLNDITTIKENERQLRQSATVFENTTEGVMITDADSVIINVNDAFSEITGRKRSEVIGKKPSILKSGRHNKAFYKLMWSSILRTGSWKGEVWNRRKNGEIYPQWLNISSVKNKLGKTESFISVFSDITILTETENNLMSLDHIINDSFNEIYVFDQKTLKFTYVNRSALTNLGYSQDEMKEMKAYDIKYEFNKGSFKKAIKPLSQGKKSKLFLKTSHVRKDGSQYPVEVHLQLMKKQDSAQYVAIVIDTTEQDKSDAKLLYQAQYDKLTELPNRNLFIDRVNQAIKQSSRSHKQLAILFIDLDRFKSINESLGHALGDSLLKEIALRLKKSIRETDSVARFGGDEFAVLIDRIDDISVISDLVNKIIEYISQKIKLDQHKLHITASIGISLYPNDGETPDILLRNADSAMYKAKDEGRNTFQYYTSEMTSKAFEHLLMENHLRKALDKHEFVVYYQPQVCAQDNHIFGMEALVRWQHPDLGMISPAKFIPLAEETGLIIPLGEEVFDIATQQIKKWMKNSSTDYRVAINLSVKQLQQTNIVKKLTKILKENKCSPEWIELEVTEGYVMKNPELAIKTLQHFSDMGVEIAVDDFGTGYSSLSYLKRLPVNKLKIDQSFVRDLSEDEDDKAIVESIIYLSKTMSLNVIAEGVETIEQKEFLQNKGCDEIQGYLYSKPVPADEMTKLLASKTIDI